MANKEHLKILGQGVDVWNEWRSKNREIIPDFRAADFRNTNLNKADFGMAWLHFANFSGARLKEVNFCGANLYNTQFVEADLRGALFIGALLLETRFDKANLSECSIYGISAWDVSLTDSIQNNLIIAPHPKYPKRALITVDNLEVAQFIYLLLNNQKIRGVIDTIGRKAVLILGRFISERKYILDAIREELRKRDYVPILFDFEKLANRDLTETISILAHMSRFVIADITEAKSIPQELQVIVPNLPSVPIQPIIQVSDYEYAMFEHFKRYPWVLPLQKYEKLDDLIAVLGEKIVETAETKANELQKL